MAFDESVAGRVRKALKTHEGIMERKMFGGIAFMLDGNMVCGVLKSDLMLRLGEQQTTKALRLPHTRDMDFTGRPMKGMILVSPEGFETEQSLRDWLKLAIHYVESLPAK